MQKITDKNNMAVPDEDDSNWKSEQSKRRWYKNLITSNKKRKLCSLNIPSAEELNSLREAEIPFHSNLFKMQVDELLKELKEKLHEKDIFLKWLEEFKEFLRKIPERSLCKIKDFTLHDSVQIPILQKPESTKGVFKFIAPEVVQEIGSFVLDTMCSDESLVDVAVEIPKACWQTLDFLNHRYHRKRAFYLACITHSLLESDLVSEMKFNFQNDCYLKPILRIIPKGVSQFTVNLTAYPNEQTFKLKRFIPVRNNVRSSWMLGTGEDHDIPTPYYNATILADLLLPKLNEYLKEQITTQNVKDAIILLKLWCKQRGLTMGYGRLNGFILTMFVSYLLKKQKINSVMNSYQIFRCSLLALQKEKLHEIGISLCDETNSGLSLEDFKKVYSVVLVELSGFLNVCYAVTEETYKMVQHEAKLGLQMLDKESPESFTHLYMNKITFCKKFDYLLHFNGAKKFKKFNKKLKCESESIDYGKDKLSCVMPKICGILRKGLGPRILFLDVLKAAHVPWAISEPPPSPNIRQVTVGILLNPNIPLNNLEKGPSADDPAAMEFRNFWGSRSEMRRFQDGTIREAVYWPAVTIADKRNVFCSMMKDILKRHIDAEEEDITVVGTEIDCALHLPESIFSKFSPYGTGEEAHMTLMQSFNSLCKQLWSLHGLPLLIASIQGTSPAFRFSEVFPPLSAEYAVDKEICFISDHVMKLKENASKVPPYLPALKVIINLEGSGKWPDDVDALNRVKAAFYVKIAQLVKSQCSLIVVPFITHADIFKDGFVFRLEIACHKEIFLMKQIRMPDGILKIKESKESHDMEVSTKILPKLNNVLHGLHQQHNTYGTACRLAKRWLSAQMKHGYIHDVAIELMIAYIYIHPEPYTCPSSPQVAFLRFLSLLISHDWNMNPLITNLNGELQSKVVGEIHAEFNVQRSTLPAVVIPTPFDQRGNVWTKNAPTALILKRIRILAQASLETLEQKISSPKSTDVKVLFRPPLQSYDVLIYLKRKQISRLYQAIDVLPSDELPVFKPYQYNDDEMYPVVEYDPVEKYLQELRQNFHEFAFFLYDVYGGDFIAVVWKKSAFTLKEFKMSRVNNRTVHQDGVSIIPDVEAILEDFYLLGSGLVKEIVKQTEKWKIP